jgi:hypothetical protein
MDNRAPTDTDPLLDRLRDEYAFLKERTEALLEAEERVPERIDEATIDRATGFVKQLKLCSGELEKARKGEKEDFLKAGRTVDKFFGDLTKLLQDAAARVQRGIESFLKLKEAEERHKREREAREAAAAAERARKAAETPETEDRAAVAEAAAEAAAERALAKPSDLVRTQSAYGGTATLQEVVAADILDLPLAARSLAEYFDEDAVLKALRNYGRANKSRIKTEIDAGRQPLPGIEFYRDTAARVS